MTVSETSSAMLRIPVHDSPASWQDGSGRVLSQSVRYSKTMLVVQVRCIFVPDSQHNSEVIVQGLKVHGVDTVEAQQCQQRHHPGAKLKDGRPMG